MPWICGSDIGRSRRGAWQRLARRGRNGRRHVVRRRSFGVVLWRSRWVAFIERVVNANFLLALLRGRQRRVLLLRLRRGLGRSFVLRAAGNGKKADKTCSKTDPRIHNSIISPVEAGRTRPQKSKVNFRTHSGTVLTKNRLIML